MKTITIRGIDADLDHAIKSRALASNESVNQWVLRALRKITGLGKEPAFTEHHDLDHLAGGWSKEETEEYQKNVQIFERIDGNVWA